MQSIEFHDVRVCDGARGRQEDECSIQLLVIVGQCMEFAIQRLGIKRKPHTMRGCPKASEPYAQSRPEKRPSTSRIRGTTPYKLKPETLCIPFGIDIRLSISTGIHRVKHFQECTLSSTFKLMAGKDKTREESVEQV